MIFNLHRCKPYFATEDGVHSIMQHGDANRRGKICITELGKRETHFYRKMVPVLRIWTGNSKRPTACGNISYQFSHDRGAKRIIFRAQRWLEGLIFPRITRACQPEIQTVSPDHSVCDVLRPEFQTDRIAGQGCATIVGMDTNFRRQPHATAEWFQIIDLLWYQNSVYSVLLIIAH
jgi:hypothetical protein